MCGTTNPSSSSEPTASRCRAPCTAASTKSGASSACPATASAVATPGGAVRVVGHPGRPVPHHRPVQPGLGGVRDLAAGPRLRWSRSPGARSPPAQTAASTMPAVPPTRSVWGDLGPPLDHYVVFQPAGVISSTSRCSATYSLPGASSRSAIGVAGQPVVQRGLGRGRRPAESRATIPRASACSSLGQRTVQGDLGQRRRQPRDAGIERVAVLARPPGPSSSGTVSGNHGPSSPRTWPSTHDQASSPSSRYVSVAATPPAYGGA